MTTLHERLQLIPFNEVETLSPEQRSLLLKALSAVTCLPPNGPKTEPLSGPVDLLKILHTILELTEPRSEKGLGDENNDDFPYF
jgi:hypothetical protein